MLAPSHLQQAVLTSAGETTAHVWLGHAGQVELRPGETTIHMLPPRMGFRRKDDQRKKEKGKSLQ